MLYLGYFWTVGTSLTPAIAYYAMKVQNSWRLFLLLCGLPGIISSLFGIIWVPESPRWLMHEHRSEEALEILKRGAATNGLLPERIYPPGSVIVLTEEELEDKENLSNIRDLFLPQWRFMVICMLLVWTFLDFIYWGTVDVVTLVFAEFEGNDAISFEEGEQYAYDYEAIISSSLAEILGQTAVLFLIDPVGRVPTQALGYAFGAISVFSLCYVGYIEGEGNSIERYGLIVLAFLSRMFIMGATSVTWYDCVLAAFY